MAFPLLGCGRESEVHQIEGVAYYFPGNQISGIVKPEESGSGRYYIRLIPPGDYYWLVYDPSRAKQPNKQGGTVPTIPHINDQPVVVTFTHENDEIDVVRNEAGMVVCKRNPVNDDASAMRQIFTCGFRVYDRGVTWNVIIPGDLVASAPALKRRAEITLADYRRMGAYQMAKRSPDRVRPQSE
jgi:hypothetical protein